MDPVFDSPQDLWREGDTDGGGRPGSQIWHRSVGKGPPAELVRGGGRDQWSDRDRKVHEGRWYVTSAPKSAQ